MGGVGRTDRAGTVGARRCDGLSEGGEQRLRHRVRRHADGDRLQTGGHQIGNLG